MKKYIFIALLFLFEKTVFSQSVNASDSAVEEYRSIQHIVDSVLKESKFDQIPQSFWLEMMKKIDTEVSPSIESFASDKRPGIKKWFDKAESIVLSYRTLMSIYAQKKANISKSVEIRDVIYGPEKRQKLDLYLPAVDGKYPIVIFFHDGAWYTGDKSQYSKFGKMMMNDKKIGVVVVNYGLYPEVLYPTNAQDVALSVSWVYHHIDSLGGDPDNIFLVGYSAGAHLASLIATNPKFLKSVGLEHNNIKGIICVSGIYKIKWTLDFVGFGKVFPKNLRYDASPVNFASNDCPPFLLMYSDDDAPTLAAQSKRMSRKLARKNCPVECTEIKGEKKHEKLFYNFNSTAFQKRILFFINNHMIRS